MSKHLKVRLRHTFMIAAIVFFSLVFLLAGWPHAFLFILLLTAGLYIDMRGYHHQLKREKNEKN